MSIPPMNWAAFNYKICCEWTSELYNAPIPSIERQISLILVPEYHYNTIWRYQCWPPQRRNFVSFCPNHMMQKYCGLTWSDTATSGTETLPRFFKCQISPLLLNVLLRPNHITLNCCARYRMSSARRHDQCHGTSNIPYPFGLYGDVGAAHVVTSSIAHYFLSNIAATLSPMSLCTNFP